MAKYSSRCWSKVPDGQRRKKVQSLTTGEQREDEQVDKDVTQAEIICHVSASQRGWRQGQQKEACCKFGENAITTAETARMTCSTAPGQMVERGRTREAGRQAQMQAKGAAVKAKERKLARARTVTRVAGSKETTPLAHAGEEKEEQHERQYLLR